MKNLFLHIPSSQPDVLKMILRGFVFNQKHLLSNLGCLTLAAPAPAEPAAAEEGAAPAVEAAPAEAPTEGKP